MDEGTRFGALDPQMADVASQHIYLQAMRERLWEYIAVLEDERGRWNAYAKSHAILDTLRELTDYEAG